MGVFGGVFARAGEVLGLGVGWPECRGSSQQDCLRYGTMASRRWYTIISHTLHVQQGVRVVQHVDLQRPLTFFNGTPQCYMTLTLLQLAYYYGEYGMFSGVLRVECDLHHRTRRPTALQRMRGRAVLLFCAWPGGCLLAAHPCCRHPKHPLPPDGRRNFFGGLLACNPTPLVLSTTVQYRTACLCQQRFSRSRGNAQTEPLLTLMHVAGV